jgi:hypothetical protein
MDMLRSAAEIGFGVLFVAGAVFNATYTMTHGTEFYHSLADGAWMPPARWMIENAVIPNATAVTVVFVLFEATVAVMILLRGDLVQPALIAGGGFALVGAAASSPGGTVANLAMAVALFTLAVTR